MDMLVAYDSRPGTTKRAAEALAEAARDRGHRVRSASIGQVTPAQVLETDMLVLGTWVRGSLFLGVGPARSTTSWIRRLPHLGDKPVAVFCTYAVHPRRTLAVLHSMLDDRGAARAGATAFQRKEPSTPARA